MIGFWWKKNNKNTFHYIFIVEIESNILILKLRLMSLLEWKANLCLTVGPVVSSFANILINSWHRICL